jgi:hypothetical protein
MMSVLRGERPDPNESTSRLGPMADGIAEMHSAIRRSGPRAAQDM